MPSYNANNKIVMQEETKSGIQRVAELSWPGKIRPELIYCDKCIYKLFVRDAGSYATDSLIHLWWIILCHRLHHFFKGEGFRD
tara:strand:- start:55 stop:303 length:249 start_codon:yes stop_codon:yes gene_type:complete